MLLGRVIGSVWSTVKNPALEGQRLLIVEPVTPELQPSGRPLICTDATRAAGAGELVYCCRGREASFPFLPAEVPADYSVVAIIDELRVKR